MPQHDSVENFVNEFSNVFKDNIYAIRMNIGVTEPPFIPSRKGVCVCDKLDTFALVSEDDMHKTTSCALDPMPAKLVKEYNEELLAFLTHIINCSIATGESPHEWKTALVVPLRKKTGMALIPKNDRPV